MQINERVFASLIFYLFCHGIFPFPESVTFPWKRAHSFSYRPTIATTTQHSEKPASVLQNSSGCLALWKRALYFLYDVVIESSLSILSNVCTPSVASMDWILKKFTAGFQEFKQKTNVGGE